MQVGNGGQGEFSALLRQHITDIRFGHRTNEHGWMHPFDRTEYAPA